MTDKKCPDQKCHDKVISMDTCLKTKISGAKVYSILGSILFALALILSSFIHSGMKSFAEQKKDISKVTVAQVINTEQITAIKEDISRINKNIDELKKQQITKEQMKEIVNEIKNIIKEAVK